MIRGRKTTKRKKTKKKTSKSLILIFIFVSAGMTIFGLFAYLHKPIASKPLAIYEEISVVSSDLNNKIIKIDRIIFQSLYKIGIDEKNIFFLEVYPQHDSDYVWEFTSLLIKSTNKASAGKLEQLILNELSKFEPEAQFLHEKTSYDKIISSISISGKKTHRIEISFGAPGLEGDNSLSKIAIIIDDIGYDYDIAQEFMKFDLPLSLSVLPFAPLTDEIVSEANRRGCELLLHLPMEPKGYPNPDPGPGALMTDMDEKKIRQRIRDNIKRVPGLKGVNHHMGSAFSERNNKMKFVLDEVKKQKLFYVDSRTTKNTVAYKLGRELGVPVAEKSLFLDHAQSSKAIIVQMEKLFGIARYSGTAVGIGHPHRQTLAILNKYHDQLKEEFELVPVSRVVK